MPFYLLSACRRKTHRVPLGGRLACLFSPNSFLAVGAAAKTRQEAPMNPDMPQDLTPELFHEKFPTAPINCGRLLDWACPECGSRGPFDLAVQAWAPLSDSGFGKPFDLEDLWGRTMFCPGCHCTVPRTVIEGLDAYLRSLADAAPL